MRSDSEMAGAPVTCVLVMPTYNEEACISRVVRGWLKEWERLFSSRFRVVVVNDGSTDGTGEILQQLAGSEPSLTVIHQQNAGHGAAVLRGYREALALDPLYIFQVDSDDQFLPRDFEKLWKRRLESPCVLGFREVRRDSLHRLAISRALRGLLALVYGYDIADSNVPFRLLEARFLRTALSLIPPDTFAPNIMIAVIGAQTGADLLHIPVAHEDRKTGRTSIVRWKLIRACVQCAGQLLRFRFTPGKLPGSAGVRSS